MQGTWKYMDRMARKHFLPFDKKVALCGAQSSFAKTGIWRLFPQEELDKRKECRSCQLVLEKS